MSTAWKPRLQPFAPTITQAGLQDLSVVFKWKRYVGHLKEEGHNAVQMIELHNSWISNVVFKNVDSAVATWGVTRSTFENIVITNGESCPASHCTWQRRPAAGGMPSTPRPDNWRRTAPPRPAPFSASTAFACLTPFRRADFPSGRSGCRLPAWPLGYGLPRPPGLLV